MLVNLIKAKNSQASGFQPSKCAEWTRVFSFTSPCEGLIYFYARACGSYGWLYIRPERQRKQIDSWREPLYTSSPIHRLVLLSAPHNTTDRVEFTIDPSPYKHCPGSSLCSHHHFKEQRNLLLILCTTGKTRRRWKTSWNDGGGEGESRGGVEAKEEGREDGNQMSKLPHPPAQLSAHPGI